MNPFFSRSLMALTLAASTVLAGCAAPKTLYQWEGYEPQVYEYFKGEEPKEAQAEALERDLQKIRSTGKAVPPGYHAHLGLLYLSMGKDDQMVQQFNTEKTLFPESGTYMDFLLKNAKAGAVQ
ncbi:MULTISPECIES: DUF4810 domain-containing protein [Pseudomonas]|jgi:hypothetical protein|uniref:Lipoprotein n=1 Tax=Pseudomonas fluorescens TaxID=294 RepID=A0AAE2AS77_PSEFL|nr:MULTISPECIES: DUF4810 domain-containing protein [Pseudomonas]KIP90052.1 lipoprotein [Pseudomonas fluorescens]KPG84930.1 hypothetical protein AEQ63_03590 [Pseudomonas sp. RIT-PI-o]MDR6162466.1 hypothetical protein [Pseudomonas fluorescens]PWB26209.1 DUF4810 domain-containing protein [Pseudomonas sp. NDM]UST61196.1 DUF4810 domain-containing protein [Pseudomonas moraviensis]